MKATTDITVATFVDGREVEVVCTAGEPVDVLPAGAAGDTLQRLLTAATPPAADASDGDEAVDPSKPTRRRK